MTTLLARTWTFVASCATYGTRVVRNGIARVAPLMHCRHRHYSLAIEQLHAATYSHTGTAAVVLYHPPDALVSGSLASYRMASVGDRREKKRRPSSLLLTRTPAKKVCAFSFSSKKTITGNKVTFCLLCSSTSVTRDSRQNT